MKWMGSVDICCGCGNHRLKINPNFHANTSKIVLLIVQEVAQLLMTFWKQTQILSDVVYCSQHVWVLPGNEKVKHVDLNLQNTIIS